MRRVPVMFRRGGWLGALATMLAACGSAPELSQGADSGSASGGAGGGSAGGAAGSIIFEPMSDASVRSDRDLPNTDETGAGVGSCGDGVKDGAEACDDGNTQPGDGCSGICTLEPGYTCPTAGEPCSTAPTSTCGNALIEGNESCDDGNVMAEDGCSRACQVEAGWACASAGQPCTRTQNARCGDGQVNAGESCDDGNQVDADGCSAGCALETRWVCPTPGRPCVKDEFCGDGEVQTARGETCDDGNGAPGDGCSGICKSEPGYDCAVAGKPCVDIWVCGNGKVDPGEVCDDSNVASLDGCSATCTTVEPGWKCPKAADGTGGPCALAPQNVCGDQVLGPRERCDDGNTAAGDGCSPTCEVEPGFTCPAGQPCTRVAFCGDGALNLDLDEQCDDGAGPGGAPISGDGCSELCKIEPNFDCPAPGQPCVSTVHCGDGRIGGAEQCDDGNAIANDGCTSCALDAGWQCITAGARCVAKACGDTIIAGVEQCDDGNTTSSDGCSAACKVEPGYACVRANGSSVCHLTVCGDNVKEGSEQCDDGNKRPFDGCYNCLYEPKCTNGVCLSACGDGQRYGSEACDDGNTQSGDGCSSTCTVETGFSCSDVVNSPPAAVRLPVVLRDFVGKDRALNGHAYHEDFNRHGGSGILGIVESALGPTGRPVYACPGSTHSVGASAPNCVVDNNPGYLYIDSGNRRNMSGAANFAQWYTDLPGATPLAGINVTLFDELVLTRRAGGDYRYDSAEAHDNGAGTSIDFFDPLHNKGWVANGYESSTCSPLRNVSFSTETHFWFEYQGGERFDFSGDDDTWVFVNGKLAVDLGGLHVRLDGYFTLDADTDGAGPDIADGKGRWGSPNMPGVPAAGIAVDFGLTQGGVYEVVMFQAERNECGSNFTVTLKNFNKPKSACASTCGDGVIAADEVCDDGKNDGSYGGCMPGCKARAPYCGDSTKQAQEDCDNGVNLVTYGGGSQQCGPGCKWAPYCGDGQASNGESCDEGTANGSGYGHCTSACKLGPRCGDAFINGAEQCDDGVDNGAVGNGCKADCTRSCGDGVLDPGEQCDDGAAANTGAYGKCTATCTLGPRCGDGFKNGAEQCDDGRNDGSYGTCRADCTTADYCGDGKTSTPPETCDKGAQNSANAYGAGQCTAACTPAPYCGNKAVDGAFGEVCDDGVNDGSPGSCLPGCKAFVPFTSCGNGSVEAPERCDDGTANGTAASACDSNCRIKCGNGVKDVGEQCDNGVNDGSYGTCRVDCTFAGYCGDGTRSGPEQCDNGTGNVPASSAYGQNVCTAACAFAPFCGDGRVQSAFGEECDGSGDCQANCRKVIVN